MSKADEFASVVRRVSAERFGSGLSLPEDCRGADTIAGLLSHRSHRAYSDEPVDDDLLRLLLACALSSPSKSDLQQADIIRVRDPGKRRAFAGLIPDMPWIGEAPVFLVFCGNGRRIRQLSAMRGREFANDHLDAFFNAAVDAAIVMGTFINAAEAAGLGCCPISAVRNHCEAVDRLLELPDLVFPVAGMCVGYPKAAGRLNPRLPLDVTAHVDAFAELELGRRIKYESVSVAAIKRMITASVRP